MRGLIQSGWNTPLFLFLMKGIRRFSPFVCIQNAHNEMGNSKMPEESAKKKVTPPSPRTPCTKKRHVAPQKCRGYVAILPTCGPPKVQGLCSHFDLVPALGTPKRAVAIQRGWGTTPSPPPPTLSNTKHTKKRLHRPFESDRMHTLFLRVCHAIRIKHGRQLLFMCLPCLVAGGLCTCVWNTRYQWGPLCFVSPSVKT